jgi:hypothetical protein
VEPLDGDEVRLERACEPQLAPNVDGQPAAWIVPPATDRETNLPHGYIVSFIRHH